MYDEWCTPERYEQLPVYEHDGDRIVVDPRCQFCGRFISLGKVLRNQLDEYKFENWFCFVCWKYSQPMWERTE